MGSVKQLGSCPQSVAERIKESTLKLQELSTQNGSSTSVAEIKTPYSVFTGRKDLNDTQLNTVRVIAQHLKELGLREAVNALVEETGCKIEHTHAAHLRKAVKTGCWNEALAVLDRSQHFISEEQYESARCELVIQKILDLLCNNEVVKVVQILRNELPRYPGNTELEQLYRLIYLTPEELRNTEVMITHNSEDYKEKVARTIEKMMPSSFMLQESRLSQLLDKALLQQVSECSYHLSDRSQQNLPADNILMDHTCAFRPDASFHSPQTISDMGEIFCSEFSPNGKMLVATSTNNNIRVYSVSKKTWSLTPLRDMAHKTARKISMVNNVSWSFDSKYIAISGGGRHPFDVCVFDAETGKTHRILKRVDNIDFTCVAFCSNHYDLAVADENGHFDIHDVTEPYEKESRYITRWEGFRIKKLRPLRSGGILALDSHNRIRKYTYRHMKSDRTVIKENMACNNFCVHKSEKFVVTATEVNLHLWDITSRTLVRSYSSCHSKGTVIQTSFGGPNDEYIASGTPNGKIFVYNINDTFPILEMKGHVSSVNTLSWHPKAAGLFVSAAADSLFRVWHVGCGLESCSLPTQLEHDSDESAIKAYQKSQKILEKQIKTERKQLRKQRKHMERVDKELSQKDVYVDVVETSSNGAIDVSMDVPSVEKLNKKKKHKKKDKKDRVEDNPLFAENGEIIDGTTKSRRKSKRRQRLGVLSMSMDVEDSSNGKAAASADLSENSSVRSHL